MQKLASADRRKQHAAARCVPAQGGQLGRQASCITSRVGKMGQPNSNGSGKAMILVVERDPHIRELESHFLHQAGYAVGFAQDGNSALEEAQRTVPDILITEILVPTLDGLALCRRLKTDPRTRDIAVLIFSILAAAGRAQEAGADAFLLKPLAEHTLVDTVRRLLEARSARLTGART